jgi:molybdopterin converting factor small subunit
MNITLFVSAHLKEYVRDFDPAEGVSIPIETGSTPRELCQKLGIPTDRVKLIFINGLHGHFDQPLQGGERVSLFPPVAGG